MSVVFDFGSLVVPQGFVGPVDVDFGEDVSSASSITLSVFKAGTAGETVFAAKTGAVVTGTPAVRRFSFVANDTSMGLRRGARLSLTYADGTVLVMHGKFVVEG